MEKKERKKTQPNKQKNKTKNNAQTKHIQNEKSSSPYDSFNFLFTNIHCHNVKHASDQNEVMSRPVQRKTCLSLFRLAMKCDMHLHHVSRRENNIITSLSRLEAIASYYLAEGRKQVSK